MAESSSLSPGKSLGAWSMTNSEEKNKDEEEIKSFCQRRAIQKATKVASFLEQVALDDAYRDLKAVKTRVNDPDGGFHYEYEEVSVPVSVNVRVTAAKTWKEMVMDKAIGDVKEKAKSTKTEAIDMKKAMEAIGKAKAAEKAAEVKEDEL
jgi:hypothetical protein